MFAPSNSDFRPIIYFKTDKNGLQVFDYQYFKFTEKVKKQPGNVL